MSVKNGQQRWLFALPLIHLLLVAVTIIGEGEWIRVIAVDPMVVPFMFSEGSLPIFMFSIFGTFAWWAIGYIGWRSANDRTGQLFGGLMGAGLLLFTLLGIAFSIFMLREDFIGRRFELVLMAQELLVGFLWVGAFISSLNCFRSASRVHDPF
jgi:hypothetical protein